MSPIVVIFGLLYACETTNTLVYVLGGISSVLGLIVGFVGWGDMVPPRWFWIQSRVSLFGGRVGTAIIYAIQFFCLPAFIMYLIEYFG